MAGVGARTPDVRYDDVDGVAWIDTSTPTEQRTRGASAAVVIGPDLVQISLAAGAPGRDQAADLLALVRQVAHSLDLG